jgi:hypothetical protein
MYYVFPPPGHATLENSDISIIAVVAIIDISLISSAAAIPTMTYHIFPLPMHGYSIF